MLSHSGAIPHTSELTTSLNLARLDFSQTRSALSYALRNGNSSTAPSVNEGLGEHQQVGSERNKQSHDPKERRGKRLRGPDHHKARIRSDFCATIRFTLPQSVSALAGTVRERPRTSPELLTLNYRHRVHADLQGLERLDFDRRRCATTDRE